VCWGGPVERAVRAVFVVVLAELVELALQLDRGARCRSGGEPALLGLVEALDLALGLRVAGGPVLLADAEQWEEVFERVAAAAEAGGVDPRVVGQGAGRRAVFVDGLQEQRDHVVAGDGLVSGR
jgi:hypothetical protein